MPYDSNENEDCLTLNVYTPAECSKKKRAVLVWIHGGDLQFGTSGQETMDGTSFATNQDIVVVGINYRLNGIANLNPGAVGAHSDLCSTWLP